MRKIIKKKDHRPDLIIFDGNVFEFWSCVNMFYKVFRNKLKKNYRFLYIGRNGSYSYITTNPFIKAISMDTNTILKNKKICSLNT